MDYVTERAELYDLRKAAQSWERKVEIASMALKVHVTCLHFAFVKVVMILIRIVPYFA